MEEKDDLLKETKLNLEDLKATMKVYQTEFETRTKELISEGSEEAKNQLVSVQEELKKVNNSLKSTQDQIKNFESQQIPGLEGKEIKEKFSVAGVCKALLVMSDKEFAGQDPWEDFGFEKEVCAELSKVKLKAAGLGDTQSGASGGFLLPLEISSEIVGLAFAAIPLMNELPVRRVTGLRGELAIPTVTGRPSGFWVGETGQPTGTKVTYGQVISRPRRAAGFTRQSKRLLFQSRNVSEGIVREELVRGLSLTVHEGLLKGIGSEFEPKGLTQFVGDFTTNVVDLGTDGGPFTFKDAQKMKLAIMTADEGNDNPKNYGFLMRDESVFNLQTQTIAQFTGQTDGEPVVIGAPILNKSQVEGLIGKFATTTQLANDLVKASGTTLSRVIYGNWRHFWVNTWGNLNLRISDQASDGTNNAFLQNQVFMLVEQEIDVQLPRPTAFTAIADADTDVS